MLLSIKSMALAGGVLLGGYGMFLTGLGNIIFPGYGERFLLTMSSVYPGYHATRSLVDVLVGAGYGFVDGAAAGAILAWTYNRFAGR